MACFDQVKIDRICEAMVRAALREAARLGVMAVEETGYGVSSDKEQKNQFAAEAVWEPEAARRCALAAARSATETLKERHDLGASVLVGQVRSMAVDLLRSTGMNQAEALAALEEAAPRSSAEP
ncbi:MAG: hypothetical protein CYG60_16855 [Actinobacteria bacterium]|jgi:hypothetical protein|nr:MAG: hypothetical protein CYG60_16855 [Actinomycetota bacterium]